MSEHAARELLAKWINRQLADEPRTWFNSQRDKIAASTTDRDLYVAVSMTARKAGKDDLRLDEADLLEAAAARSGWDPRGWSIDQAVRVALLLYAPATDAETFRHRLDQLCATADVAELVAFCRGLPLYPHPEAHRDRAAEGVRSNMRPVYEAVAHRNPYPSEQLAEGPWNHMVLKALFIGTHLAPIVGLDARANPALAVMLTDYAHERWAAKRDVSPELWRGVGAHATPAMLSDFERLLKVGTETEKQAAVLALRVCPLDGARKLLEAESERNAQAEAGAFDWEAIAYA